MPAFAETLECIERRTADTVLNGDDLGACLSDKIVDRSACFLQRHIARARDTQNGLVEGERGHIWPSRSIKPPQQVGTIGFPDQYRHDSRSIEEH